MKNAVCRVHGERLFLSTSLIEELSLILPELLSTPSTDETDYHFLVDNCTDILCSIASDGTIRYISPSCFEILGWKQPEMTGRNLSQFIFSEDVSWLENLLRSALRNTAACTHALLRFIRSDRTNVWISINARCVRDSTSANNHKLALCMRDATERTALEENLSLLAMTDSLTKLWNRRTFDHALRREWKLAFREGSPLSLLLVDLDHFKLLNDQYGHSVGDECLCDVASVLLETVRTTDIVCRWGGDEIAVILPATDAVGACAVADKLCAAIEALRFRSRKESAQSASITASIGVATVKCDQEEAMTGPHDLLRAADKALYQAKNDGRNRVRGQELVSAS